MKIKLWFKNFFFFKEKVVFSFDIISTNILEKPFMYVNYDGFLMYKDSVFDNQISALIEWDQKLKQKFKVNQKIMVIDVVLK